MEQQEFRELFISNHKKVCKNICNFFDVDMETINRMLTKSYMSIAGGYARRLYMVKNDLEFTQADIREYMNSDVDMFVYSIHAEEKVQAALNDFENTFALQHNAQMGNIHVSYQSDYKYSVYTGVKGDETRTIMFNPLGRKLKNLSIIKHDRPYTFYKDSLIMTSAFGKMSLFNIRDVSQLDDNVPSLQFIKSSKSKLRDMMNKTGTPSGTHIYTKQLMKTFDMSQTRFYINTLSEDVDKTLVSSVDANLGEQIYNCDISDNVINNVNIFTRIRKYSGIGMKFKKEDIDKLLLPNKSKEIGSSVIEGGYY